jgi:hypothetical protein
MGGSIWSHWVPYQPDAARALQVLRDDVFERRDFYRGKEADYADARTTEDAIRIGSECGTNSVLDISNGISHAPRFGASCALNERQLLALFDTTKPQRPAVEAERSSLEAMCDRYEAVHLVVYDDDGGPAWLLFVGYSGD